MHFQIKKIIKNKINARSFKIHHASNIIKWRFTLSKNEIGEDSPIPKFMYLKNQDSTSRCRRIFDDPWGGWVQGAHWRLHKSCWLFEKYLFGGKIWCKTMLNSGLGCVFSYWGTFWKRLVVHVYTLIFECPESSHTLISTYGRVWKNLC